MGHRRERADIRKRPRNTDLIAFLLVFLVLLITETQPATARSLCVVPVPVDRNEWTDLHSLNYHSTARGLDYPLLYGRYSSNAGWRLTRERHLEPVEKGGFPKNYLDKFVIEPSGRVLGYAHLSRMIQVRLPGEDRFRPLLLDGFDRGPGSHPNQVYAMAWIEHLGGTAISTRMDGTQLLKGNSLTPIPRLEGVDIGAVSQIKDLPEIKAVALVDGPDRGFVLDWTGRIQTFSGWSFWDFFSQNNRLHVAGLESRGRLVVTRRDYEIVFSLTQTDGGLVLDEEGRYYRPPTTNSGRYFPSVGQRLRYDYLSKRENRSGLPLMRLSEDGWVPVAGAGRKLLGESASLFEIPSQKSVIVRGQDGHLYRYLGQGPLSPITGSREAVAGRYPDILEVSSFDKVVVAGKQGIFELTADNKLVPLSPPRNIHLGPIHRIAELPASGALIVFGTGGIFAMDRAGNFEPVRGAGPVKHNMQDYHGVHVLPLTKRSEILLDASGAFFLVLDEAVTGQGACAEAIVNETNGTAVKIE